MSDETLQGRFVWYELLTSDPDAAKGFYTELIGWDTAEWGEGENPYVMWTLDGTPEGSMGGVIPLPEEAKKMGAPPHWLPYLGTSDIEGTVSEAEKLGGKALVPLTEIPTVGRFAVLSDPQGAVFAVFTPAEQPPGHEGPAQIMEFSWHELATTDHSAAFEFYQALFGWNKTESMDMGPMGIYQMYGRGEMTLGGMFNKSEDMPGPSAWLLYIEVEDVDHTARKVQELGGKILNGPMEVPGGGRIAQCMDPQGAAFAIHSADGQAA
jgi:predicted enzyme related to lactoylglutathione lyase